jgi:transmembrane sensor
MTPEPSRNDLPAEILEEASSWVIEFNEGELDAGQRARFNEWIRRSPEHMRAYFEIGAMWEEALGLDPERRTSPDALLAEARMASNVVPLGSDRGVIGQAALPARTQRVWAIAAAIVVALGVLSTWAWWQRDLYSTGIGEQRSIVLSDGSTVELNSQSQVRIDYSNRMRKVELVKGQALFDVQPDAQRPFEVESAGTTARALGTRFDVYRKRRGTVVTVIEGQVAVRDESRPEISASTVLSAGQRATLEPDRQVRTERTDLAAATAWTARQLVFDGTPLAEAVEEINRYNARQLVIEDRRLDDFHIRGTFTATDPAPLVRFLKARFGFAVEETQEEIHLSSASEK